jgi:hypothetical protein
MYTNIVEKGAGASSSSGFLVTPIESVETIIVWKVLDPAEVDNDQIINVVISVLTTLLGTLITL